jgi:exopolysaccharide production protein ExoQ
MSVEQALRSAYPLHAQSRGREDARLQISELAERLFTIASLFLFSDALIPLLHRQAGFEGTEVEGDPVQQICWFAIYFVTFVLISRSPQRVVRAMLRDRWVLLITGLAFASALWSPAPLVTLRHSVGLVGTTLFAAYVASRYEPREILDLVFSALTLVAVLSLAFVALLPAYGIHHADVHDGLWRGVFTGKNHLGRIMALYGVVCIACIRDKSRPRGKYVAGLLLAALLAFKAQSMTALVVVVTTPVLILFLMVFRLRPIYSIPLSVIAAVLGAVVGTVLWANVGLILSSVGRDVTLTGRTVLWAAVLQKIFERKWLGYGFGSFWIGTPDTSQAVWSVTYAINRWEPISAHNGFLDLALALGVLGVLIFLFGMASIVRKSFFRWNNGTQFGFWPVAYLIVMILENMGETSLFRQNNVYWVLYVIIAFAASPRTLQVPARVPKQRLPASA